MKKEAGLPHKYRLNSFASAVEDGGQRRQEKNSPILQGTKVKRGTYPEVPMPNHVYQITYYDVCSKREYDASAVPLPKETNTCFITLAMMFLRAKGITLGCQANFFKCLKLSNSGQDFTLLLTHHSKYAPSHHSRIPQNFIFSQERY